MSTDRFHPLVSIVIPVYNGANYMREAIDSALAQTYDRTEVIVVNDGSRDEGETDRIARSYGDRIRYFTKANGGCGSALNFGIERMRGDYFSWLSHDDLYLPHKIEHQIALLGRVSDKRTILFGGWEVFDKYGKSIVHVRPNIVHSQRKLDTPLYALMRGLIHGCSLLVPTALFRDIGTFDESLPTTQDYALWFRFMRTAPVHFDSEILIRSRAHPEQGSHSVSGHIEECNTLWCGFLSELTDEEMIAMEGSRYLFLRRTEAFLSQTPYGKARALAAEMALAELERTKVSVVIPFHNRIMWTLEAVESALEQTHSNVEILLVDDGSTDDLSPIRTACHNDKRLRLLQQPNSGPARARNYGVEHAVGEYVAFLDSDDTFHKEKLARQLRHMLDHQYSFSHTSYQKMDLEGNSLEHVPSGAFAGRVFPRVIASCPIAMPTVMGKRDIFLSHRFPEDIDIGEDVCLWIRLASLFELGGLDEPLSRVRTGPSSAAYNKRKQAIGMVNILNFVVQDDFYSQFDRQLFSLFTDAAGIFRPKPEMEAQAPVTASAATQSAPATDLDESPPPQPSLVAMTFRSLRNDGAKVTLGRIFRKILS